LDCQSRATEQQDSFPHHPLALNLTELNDKSTKKNGSLQESEYSKNIPLSIVVHSVFKDYIKLESNLPSSTTQESSSYVITEEKHDVYIVHESERNRIHIDRVTRHGTIYGMLEIELLLRLFILLASSYDFVL